MNKRQIFTQTAALMALALPVIALAHGGVEDGHIEEVVTAAPVVGASALLVPGTSAWFGLLAVSTLITSLISYGVYRYIQVAPVETKKLEVNAEKK